MKTRLWISTLLLVSTTIVVGCGMTGGHNLPPASRLAEPGPGVGGPGPGVLTPPRPPVSPVSAIESIGQDVGFADGSSIGGSYMSGDGCLGDHVSGDGCLDGCLGTAAGVVVQDVQVLFSRPEAMQIQWDVSGVSQFDSMPLVTPGRQNFQQGGIYRLKLTNIQDREGVELYPTLEIGPPAYRSIAYLAHNAIPVQFTEEDFDQVLAGNFVTKVIYLPDPEHQGLAVADVATLVSTRLDPGLDPIEEASEKGVILAIVRLGNKDIEMPNADGMGDYVVPASYTGQVSPTPIGPHGPHPIHGYAHGFGYVAPNTMDMPPGGTPAGLVSGVNVPQYGMTTSGTPIGLPGPPHIPLGGPAGLKKHVMKNWTHRSIPDPVSNVRVNVRQRPGLSYPHPPSKAWITEDTIHPSVHYGYHHYGAPSTDQIHYNCGPGCTLHQ